MATCPTGTYELQGDCYKNGTLEFVKSLENASTTSKDDKTKDDKTKKGTSNTSALEWVTGILSVLGQAAPGVIAASKGHTVPTKWTDPNNPYGETPSPSKSPAPPATPSPSSEGGGIPKWVWWAVGGVAAMIALVVGVKFFASKSKA